jgi:hypothetical protein
MRSASRWQWSRDLEAQPVFDCDHTRRRPHAHRHQQQRGFGNCKYRSYPAARACADDHHRHGAMIPRNSRLTHHPSYLTNGVHLTPVTDPPSRRRCALGCCAGPPSRRLCVGVHLAPSSPGLHATPGRSSQNLSSAPCSALPERDQGGHGAPSHRAGRESTGSVEKLGVPAVRGSRSAAPASTANSVPASASCSRPSIPPQS